MSKVEIEVTKLATHNNYSGIDFSGKDLVKQDARASNFSDTKLKKANLDGANFQGCDFTGSDVTEEFLKEKGCDVRWATFGEAKKKVIKDEFDYKANLKIAKDNELFEGKQPSKDELKVLIEKFNLNNS